MKNFCPNCGKSTKQLFRGFCKDCFLQSNKIIVFPNEAFIETCKHCFRVKFKGKMFSQSKELLDELLESLLKTNYLTKPSVSIKLDSKDDGTSLAEITVSGLLDGKPLETKTESKLKPHYFTCDDCMKLSSNYHEAIIQLRFSKEFSEKKREQLLKEINKLLEKLREEDFLSGIVKQIKVTGGIDLFIGSRKAAKAVAEKLSRKFNSKPEPSYTLVGLDKKQRRKYRTTFLLRF